MIYNHVKNYPPYVLYFRYTVSYYAVSRASLLMRIYVLSLSSDLMWYWYLCQLISGSGEYHVWGWDKWVYDSITSREVTMDKWLLKERIHNDNLTSFFDGPAWKNGVWESKYVSRIQIKTPPSTRYSAFVRIISGTPFYYLKSLWYDPLLYRAGLRPIGSPLGLSRVFPYIICVTE